MFSLLIWTCLAAEPNYCKVELIASGFTAVEPCKFYSEMLVKGHLALHPERVMRAGTRPLCTTEANWLLYRFQA